MTNIFKTKSKTFVVFSSSYQLKNLRLMWEILGFQQEILQQERDLRNYPFQGLHSTDEKLRSQKVKTLQLTTLTTKRYLQKQSSLRPRYFINIMSITHYLYPKRKSVTVSHSGNGEMGGRI